MNPRATIACVLLVITAAGLACGSSGTESELESSELEAAIAIGRGGGIAGTVYETRIEPDGSGLFDEREAFGPEVEPESFTVGDAELFELAELADATPFDEIGDAIEPRCADCFVYEVTYGEERLRVDSATLSRGEPGEEAGALIAALEDLAPDPDAG